MRKLLLVLPMLFSTFSIAVAQPAMSQKGSINDVVVGTDCVQSARDLLQVEIISYEYEHFSHPQHPENGVVCGFSKVFMPSDYFDSCLWETSSSQHGSVFTNHVFECDFYESGYIKLTVWDNLGNMGSDSIWFNVKEGFSPMEDFVMEINDDFRAEFSGVATNEHRELYIMRARSAADFVEAGDVWLEPGNWSYTDEAVYDEDNLWMYLAYLSDTCGVWKEDYIPGMLLSAVTDGSTNYLSTSTILQQYGDYYHQFGNWVYFVYTIDQDGVRHHFVESGEPVVLPDDALRWEIPGLHPDPYYQCGVAQVKDDGTYKLLSLSNKVPNPLLDPTGVDEHNDVFNVYPNPAQGRFTVEGTGRLTITNALGQTILAQEIDGKTSIELPKGLYFAKMCNTVRKIVVE